MGVFFLQSRPKIKNIRYICKIHFIRNTQMKIFIIALVMTLASGMAGAASYNELAGDYEVSSANFNLQGKVTIGLDGKLKFMVSSTFIYLNCEGQSEILENHLISTPACDNGMPLNFKIDLTNITNFQAFKTLVYTSLLNGEMEMEFKRL